MSIGKLISFEGIEGVGKSTTISSIRKYLEDNGITVYCTREPGGTKYGESLRNILLNNKSNISPEAELLLLFSMRSQHIEEIIKPKLDQGNWVLCDRFIDASIAYQGFGKKIDLKKIKIEDLLKREVREPNKELLKKDSEIKNDILNWIVENN